tara:strand:- start:5321 stop:6664 length:1344 start_codon:yes stop_codon:yes gene_type:complete
VTVHIHVFSESEFDQWLDKSDKYIDRWVKSHGYAPSHGASLIIPSTSGDIASVIICLNPKKAARTIGKLVHKLPGGKYKLSVADDNHHRIHALTLYWNLACYQFSQYKELNSPERQLITDKQVDEDLLNAQTSAVFMVRDLINTPAHDMTPTKLCDYAQSLNASYQGKVKRYTGDELLEAGFPLVHTVGRASENIPELIVCNWGDKGPLISIIGKGVTFDSGGLNIKPSRYMYPMKKDMGGAAHAIGLAHMMLATKQPCRIQLIVPAAENSISSNAYRPSDVLKSRSGKTIEVGDTDAEGRLLLADSLTYACESSPDLIIDFATLTGAARVAMGPDVPCYFTNSDEVAQHIKDGSELHEDQVWRMPLVDSYREFIGSQIADVHSTGSEPYGGAIITSLFLQEFVSATNWVHLDINAVNNRTRDGQPKGGEAQGLMCIFDMLTEWIKR